MNRLVVWGLQNLFFPRYHRPPQPGWEAILTSWGSWERLEIPRGGRRLAALCIRAGHESKARPKALLVHPRSRRSKLFFTTCQRASWHLEAGCDVVLLDLNGFGESDRIDLDYASDVSESARFLGSEGAPVLVHGLSFGSYQVALAVPNLPEGAAVILENCSRSFRDGWRHWRLPRVGAGLLERFVPGWDERYDAQRIFADSDRSDLLLVGIGSGDDRFTPAEELGELLGRFPHEHRLHVIEGAAHLKAPMVDAVRYRMALIDAWRHIGLAPPCSIDEDLRTKKR